MGPHARIIRAYHCFSHYTKWPLHLCIHWQICVRKLSYLSSSSFLSSFHSVLFPFFNYLTFADSVNMPQVSPVDLRHLWNFLYFIHVQSNINLDRIITFAVRLYYFLFIVEEKDMERVFKLPATTFIGRPNETALPLKEILNRLEQAYCRHIGVEFMFINSLEQCNWIRKRFETPGIMDLDSDGKRLLLARLARATGYTLFTCGNQRGRRANLIDTLLIGILYVHE